MKLTLALTLLAAAGPAIADDDTYSTARIVDAGQSTELQAGAFGSVDNANVNSITVELDGMLITAEYQTLLAGGKNASSNFIVGSDVQARIQGKRLWILRDDGKPLKIRITRREILEP